MEPCKIQSICIIINHFTIHMWFSTYDSEFVIFFLYHQFHHRNDVLLWGRHSNILRFFGLRCIGQCASEVIMFKIKNSQHRRLSNVHPFSSAVIGNARLFSFFSVEFLIKIAIKASVVLTIPWWWVLIRYLTKCTIASQCSLIGSAEKCTHWCLINCITEVESCYLCT